MVRTHIPAGHLGWATAVVLSVLLAALAGAVGVFRGDEVTGRPVPATVVAGASCTGANPREKVEFTVGGRRHRANFDGCGHLENERVAVSVPAGPVDGNLTVRAANAAVGDGGGEGLGPLLMVLGGMAGAGYAFLLRRA